MKKRLLRQLCRILNLSDDFIRRHRKIFKALLEDNSGSGGGGSKEKFVPTGGLESVYVKVNNKQEKDGYYLYQVIDDSIINELLVISDLSLNIYFNRPTVSLSEDEAIVEFDTEHILFYYNSNNLYGGHFYFDNNDNLCIVTNLNSNAGTFTITVPITEQLYIKYED